MQQARVIPKSTPGGWRLILDLSFPWQHSVNDGIAKELCSLHYPTVDEAIGHILKLGKGALIRHKTGVQKYPNSSTGQASVRRAMGG